MASLPPTGSMTSSRKAISWPVGKCDFLRCLTVEAIEDFESIAWSKSFPVGTMLFTEGQTPAEVFILVQGEVKLSVTSVGGKRFILRIAQPGEILGLASVFSGHSSEMTAEALHHCDVAHLRREDFLGFLGRYPPVHQFAVRELSLYYEQACVRLRTMGVASVVAAKLARLLLEWSPERNQRERNSLIRMALTHSEIGECIGTSRETVTRVLRKFQRQAIVEMRGSTLEIIDRPALEECAGVSGAVLRSH
jgi:CRP/FNR family cyclic AMP-dependent transcriptional regulator